MSSTIRVRRLAAATLATLATLATGALLLAPVPGASASVALATGPPASTSSSLVSSALGAAAIPPPAPAPAPAQVPAARPRGQRTLGESGDLRLGYLLGAIMLATMFAMAGYFLPNPRKDPH